MLFWLGPYSSGPAGVVQQLGLFYMYILSFLNTLTAVLEQFVIAHSHTYESVMTSTAQPWTPVGRHSFASEDIVIFCCSFFIELEDWHILSPVQRVLF